VVSSTATTLVYARHAAAGTLPVAAALLVILLANATMLVRVLVLVGVVAPMSLPLALVVIVPALLVAAAGIAWRWASAASAPPAGEAAFSNPTQLRTALGFGAIYAVILLLAAWANDLLGSRGMLALAAVSGLTDVDAITLSSLRLLDNGTLSQVTALSALGVAVASNLVFKAVAAATAGGQTMRWPVLLAFGGPLVALAAGMWALHALA
jgi:uncharacterized membrane protein (DUF4010 family)